MRMRKLTCGAHGGSAERWHTFGARVRDCRHVGRSFSAGFERLVEARLSMPNTLDETSGREEQMLGNVQAYVRVLHRAVAGELGVAAGVRWSSRPSVGYVRRPWSIGSPSAEPPVTTSHLADGAVVDGLRSMKSTNATRPRARRAARARAAARQRACGARTGRSGGRARGGDRNTRGHRLFTCRAMSMQKVCTGAKAA